MSLDHVIPTGFQSIDQILNGGFHSKSLNIIAARPGMGKTAFALQLAVNMAKNSGKSVCFLTLEMTTEQLNRRVKELIQKGEKLSESSILFVDSASITPNQIRKKLSSIQDLGAVFLDYVQLMEPNNGHVQGIENSCMIIRELKLIADDFGIPVIGLSQLRRTVEDRQDRRPALHDFLAKDAIEQYADTVLFLYRDAYYDYMADKSTAEIMVSYNRYGNTDILKFFWSDETLTFSEALK